MTIKKILLMALLTIVCQGLMAQGIRISGTLTDNDGPVMMGNVVEVDANNRIVSATQTDFNGNFSMQVKSAKNKLKFSYVGDKTKVMAIGSQTVFKVKLESENTQLKEVVVKSKRSASGGLMIAKKELSVSQQTFNMENVEGLAFTSADEALQGEIAGLDIVSNSGNLGAGTSMRLRGVTTINGDANPLIVVDDKIFDNPDENFDFANATDEQYASLLSVNVEDIANIVVLKDAAATAIWGSNGSNGVIQITTKHGTRGKPRVTFSYKFTGTWQPKGYTLLDGDDYTMLMKEEFYNPSQDKDATRTMYELNYRSSWPEYENWNNNTDWVGAVTQFGAMHDYNLSLTGGGQKATFRISAGYKHQTGSIIKQKFQQFTTRMVLDYNVSDRIRFSTNFALTYTGNDKNYSNLLSIAQKIAPNMSIYRQDANGNDTDEFYIMNPSDSNHSPAGGGNY
jgi:TonB-dependent SusC/RagA subfamily outer membrane receptor